MKLKLLYDYLNKNRERNISILGFIENYPLNNVYIEGETVLVTGKSDHLWAYISSKNKKELEEVLKKFKFETKYFASLEKWMIPIVTEDRGIEWELKTYRYIFPENIQIRTSTNKTKELNNTYLNYIYNYSDYQQFTSVDYINDRINKDISVGIFDSDKLVAWGLIHDDGAIGFLHVIPEYRGKGYGKDVVKTLIKKKREAGKPIYANVEPQNIKSKNLLTGLGFVLDKEISWVKVV